MHKLLVLIFLIVFAVGVSSKAEMVYFLVGEINPYHNDCYLLPLDNPSDIEHARDLIEYGPGIGGAIVGGYVEPWYEEGININRNYLQAGMPAWSWSVIFVGFADVAVEICDGWPGWVEECPECWSQICFWSYTVIAELGTDLEPWFCNLDVDDDLDFEDFAMFADRWMESGCGHRCWCGGADINGSGAVDMNDFAIFAENWLWSN
jgi:hypothetical protein